MSEILASVSLRTAGPADASRLAALGLQVWLHTYASQGVTQTIADYVLAEFTPQRMAERLETPGVHAIVAEMDAALVAYAVLRFCMPCPEDLRLTTELETLYVQAPFIGKGVGKMLLNAAQTASALQGAGPLWLTVNTLNHNAIAFYERQRYETIGTMDFVLDGQRYPNYVMRGPECSA